MSSNNANNKDINSMIPYPIKFTLGGLAGMSATIIVQPFDLIKSRLQVQGNAFVLKTNVTNQYFK